MISSNAAVSTSLIILYLIGIIVLGITFFVLDKINGKMWTRFSMGLISVILVLGVILITLFRA
mgnify:CR=1 FL=1